MTNENGFLSKENRRFITLVCNQWIKGNLTAQEITNKINTLCWASKVCLKLENTNNIAFNVDLLIEDILEKESISNEEKNKSILELIEVNKEELNVLAKRIIEHIEIERKNFKETKYLHCCNKMNYYSDPYSEEHELVNYEPETRSYNFILHGDDFGMHQGFDYCPWCGIKLPTDLSEEWCKIIKEKFDLDEVDAEEWEKLPKKFKTEEWWRKLGL